MDSFLLLEVLEVEFVVHLETIHFEVVPRVFIACIKEFGTL